jgi:hypothetical protein
MDMPLPYSSTMTAGENEKRENAIQSAQVLAERCAATCPSKNHDPPSFRKIPSLW